MESAKCFVVDKNGVPVNMASEQEYDSMRGLFYLFTDQDAGGIGTGGNAWMNISELSCRENPGQQANSYSCKIEAQFPLSRVNPRKIEPCRQNSPNDPDCVY